MKVIRDKDIDHFHFYVTYKTIQNEEGVAFVGSLHLDAIDGLFDDEFVNELSEMKAGEERRIKSFAERMDIVKD
jgi:hypothetical protein